MFLQKSIKFCSSINFEANRQTLKKKDGDPFGPSYLKHLFTLHPNQILTRNIVGMQSYFSFILTLNYLSFSILSKKTSKFEACMNTCSWK